jgi:hypothetical protein
MTKHAEMIDSLVADDQSLKRGGFRQTLRRIFMDSDEIDEIDVDVVLRRHTMLPDLHSVDEGDDHIVVRVFECENTNRLSRHKLLQYSDLAWDLDATYVSLVVVAVDRYGGKRLYDHVELMGLGLDGDDNEVRG